MSGSLDEDRTIKSQLVKSGVLIPLPKYNNCYLARTDPKVKQISHKICFKKLSYGKFFFTKVTF